MTVSLLDSSGSPVNDAAGNPIQFVTANDGSANPGYYYFPGIPPGDYKVKFNPATTGTTYAFSPGDQGSNDAQDSDANVFTGTTPTITLGASDTNTDSDAGLYVPEATTGG